MPAIVRSYEWSTHDHGMSQNGRKAQQHGPVAHLTERKSTKLAPFRLIAPLDEKLTAYLAKKLTFATPGPCTGVRRITDPKIAGCARHPRADHCSEASMIDSMQSRMISGML